MILLTLMVVLRSWAENPAVEGVSDSIGMDEGEFLLFFTLLAGKTGETD